MFKKIKSFLLNENTDEFTIKENTASAEYDVRKESKKEEVPAISKNINETYAYIKERFSFPENNDVVMREFTIKGGVNCFVVFIDGMVKTDHINEGIIKSMQELSILEGEYTLTENIMKKFVSHSQAQVMIDYDLICEEINYGSAAVFVDGLNVSFVMDVRGWEHRSVDTPQNEQSIYGPQEAFGEMLRTNSALVRKILKTERVICEAVKIGTVSKTRGVLMYIKGVTNTELVDEVRRRINGISMEYVIAIEDVALMIEENTYAVTNRIMTTERPDRAARALTEGKAILLLNGSPNALILPTTALDMATAASDRYMRYDYANMTRLVRIVAYFFACLLPAFYLAATLFHQEIIPTYLLYSISASRENVPFSSLIELLLMDFAFEMIREASIRMPSPMGSTLGIVGGLILGQSAVSAKIVSPITIIIVAVTGIGSFASVDYSLGWTYRILRLGFIILAATLGFYGIALGIVIYSVYIARIKSFGVPFLPDKFFTGKNTAANTLAVNPIWKAEKRADYLGTKDTRLEPKISRKWKYKRKK